METITINNSTYRVTSTCERPRLKVINEGTKTSYIPLTTGVGRFGIKSNGSQYRALIYTITSVGSSTSTSAQSTYGTAGTRATLTSNYTESYATTTNTVTTSWNSTIIWSAYSTGSAYPANINTLALTKSSQSAMVGMTTGTGHYTISTTSGWYGYYNTDYECGSHTFTSWYGNGYDLISYSKSYIESYSSRGDGDSYSCRDTYQRNGTAVGDLPTIGDPTIQFIMNYTNLDTFKQQDSDGSGGHYLFSEWAWCAYHAAGQQQLWRLSATYTSSYTYYRTRNVVTSIAQTTNRSSTYTKSASISTSRTTSVSSTTFA